MNKPNPVYYHWYTISPVIHTQGRVPRMCIEGAFGFGRKTLREDSKVTPHPT